MKVSRAFGRCDPFPIYLKENEPECLPIHLPVLDNPVGYAGIIICAIAYEDQGMIQLFTTIHTRLGAPFSQDPSRIRLEDITIAGDGHHHWPLCHCCHEGVLITTGHHMIALDPGGRLVVIGMTGFLTVSEFVVSCWHERVLHRISEGVLDVPTLKEERKGVNQP